MKRARSNRGLLTLLVLSMVMTVSSVAGAAPNTDGSSESVRGDGIYIVWMADDPVVAYEGDIAGLRATKPDTGKKINPNSAAVRKYQNYLESQHDAALDGVGISTDQKFYDYSVVFNGFAAQMTGAQATALDKQANVLGVFENELHKLDTVTTPEFIGMTGETGAWALGSKGEDVIVGVVDSGIWPESPSFSDQTDLSIVTGNGNAKKNPAYGPAPAGWSGTCQSGENFSQDDCNDKVIGARYYNAGFGGNQAVNTTFTYEFLSPRDADGHGSHTSGTAAGNEGAEVIVAGESRGFASGIAPRARVAMYKACWGEGADPAAGCFTMDTTAAIDQAVADGVDVINYSISGTRTNFLDSVEISFLFAADAGVFVATSAGNSGPGASTVAHPSPWVTSVAATTHDRAYEANVTLGNGDSYTGASWQENDLGSLDLVYSGDVGLAGADPGQVALCYPGTLDSAQVAGKMVLCDRGVIARVSKSAAVAQAGGLAMIMRNVSPSSINADFHAVPSIHVTVDDGVAIKAYMDSVSAPTAELGNGVLTIDTDAPQVAAFSSRGPLLASADLLKPDIAAPGVDVLAPVSPVFGGEIYSLLSGTSMSSPHIAGMAAVVAGANPDWSPMAIKSALMTTTTDIADATPFDEGAGFADPTSALDPGLVYDSGFFEWLGFLCGSTNGVSQGTCDFLASIGVPFDASDFNGASITIGDLAGAQTVVRTVTNVGDAGTYEVSVDAPEGIAVEVNPSTMTLGNGDSASYEVSFSATESSLLDEYVFGSLTWSDGTHDVKSPLTVRALPVAAPSEVSGTGLEGSVSYDVIFGYSGAFDTAGHGLVAADTTADTVIDDPANDIVTALGNGIGINVYQVEVPADTAFARWSLFNDDTDGVDDLDLYLFEGDSIDLADLIGQSGNGDSNEEVHAVLPAAGTYTVVVHGWGTDGPDAEFTLSGWLIPLAAGDLAVDAPATAVATETGTVTASWTGLDALTRYLGAVSYSTGGELLDFTLVSVVTE